MRCSSRVRPARPGERATIESTFHFAIVPFRHARIPSAPRALRLTSSDVRPLFPAATRAETFVRKMEAAQTKLWRAVRREVSRASRVGPSDSSAASVSSVSSTSSASRARDQSTRPVLLNTLTCATGSRAPSPDGGAIACNKASCHREQAKMHSFSAFHAYVQCLPPPGSPQRAPRRRRR